MIDTVHAILTKKSARRRKSVEIRLAKSLSEQATPWL